MLHTLLTRINQFSDDLALCRVRKLNDDLNQIAQALKETPKKSQNLTDLFFRLLKDRFQHRVCKLLSSGEKALPALVSWCAKQGYVPAGADPAVQSRCRNMSASISL